MACDAQTLITAAYSQGYAKLSDRDLMECIVASACSSGAGLVAGNYAAGQPNFTPISGAGSAVDTSNGAFWLYYSGGWHAH